MHNVILQKDFRTCFILTGIAQCQINRYEQGWTDSRITAYVRICAHNCYVDVFDKLQQQLYRTSGPILVVSLETLAHGWNIANLTQFYAYYIGNWSSELDELVPLCYFLRLFMLYCLTDFSLTIHRFKSLFLISTIFFCTECYEVLWLYSFSFDL